MAKLFLQIKGVNITGMINVVNLVDDLVPQVSSVCVCVLSLSKTVSAVTNTYEDFSFCISSNMMQINAIDVTGINNAIAAVTELTPQV